MTEREGGFFDYNGAVAIIRSSGSHAGLRAEFSQERYESARIIAEEEFLELPSLIPIRTKEILDPELLNKGDIINLSSGKVFPTTKDQQYLGLCVRLLSPDIPGLELSSEELKQLSRVFQEKQISLEDFQIEVRNRINRLKNK